MVPQLLRLFQDPNVLSDVAGRLKNCVGERPYGIFKLLGKSVLDNLASLYPDVLGPLLTDSGQLPYFDQFLGLVNHFGQIGLPPDLPDKRQELEALNIGRLDVDAYQRQVRPSPQDDAAYSRRVLRSAAYQPKPYDIYTAYFPTH